MVTKMTDSQKRRIATRKQRQNRRTLLGRLKRCAEKANRSASELGMDERITTSELTELYMKQSGRCAISGNLLTVKDPNSQSFLSLDHVIGLRCKSGLGKNTIANMQLVRLPLNKRKSVNPLCKLFKRDRPVVTRAVMDSFEEEDIEVLVESQRAQMNALGFLPKPGFAVVANYVEKRKKCAG